MNSDDQHPTIHDRIRQAARDVIERADFVHADEDQITALAFVIADNVTNALGVDHTTSHIYMSTSCRHSRHDYCKSSTGSNPRGTTWAKNPAACKFCDAPCICWCHVDITDKQALRSWMRQARER